MDGYWAPHVKHISRRRMLGGTALTGAAALAAACGGSSTNSNKSASTSAAPQRPGQSPTAATGLPAGSATRGVSANAPELKIADSGLMASTTNSDPNVATTPANALTNVFDPLVKLDQQYHLQPAAADKWETPDATTWTFTIHPGISFHNGDPLTSADVKYSLDRIMNNNKDFPQFIYYSPYIDSVTTPDANTLQIKTKGSNAVLANRLSILSVVPQKYIEGQGLPNFQQHPIGSGPYKFESWTAGQSITIVRNDTYWRGKPPFPRVTFQTVTDESTRLNLIQAKQVTLADNMPANMLDSLKASGFKVANAPSAQIIFLGANCNQPPLNDIRLRQALAYAIDGDAIKKAIFSDSMLQIGSPATPLDAGYDPTIQPIPHDVAKAKQLLSAAGVATTLDISLLAGTGSNFFRVPEMAQAVAGQLQAAGIKVTLNLEAAGKSGQDYLTGTVPGLHEFTCGDIIGDVSHCTQLLFNQRALYYKSQPVIDTLVKMDQTLDATARKQLQSQALKMIAADVPWVFSYAEYHRFAMDPRLEFTEVPDGNYNMFDTRWNG